MRVLHIINGEYYSGAERVQDLLAIRLKKHGYQVDFVCVKPKDFPRRRIANNSRIYFVKMSSRLDILAVIRLISILTRNNYQLIHTHTPRSALIGRLAAFVMRIPMVHHVHSPTAQCTESWSRNILNTTSEKLSLFGIKRLIPVSNSLKQYLIERGHNTQQIQVVPNGVPTQSEPTPKDRPDNTEWILGCVALFRPRKGLEVLLDAIAKLKAQGIKVKLHAVGEFETIKYKDYIKQYAARLRVENDIVWTGFCEDVNAELSKMDIFVLPSLFGEGMPMVLLEAMAIGVPVIATNVEGIPEVIENNLNGILLTPGNAKALATSIGDLIRGRTDWHLIRKAAYLHQVKYYSDLTMAAGVAQVYNQILSGSSP